MKPRCGSCRHIDSNWHCRLRYKEEDTKVDSLESICDRFEMPNKRKWCYVQHPARFDMRCDRCMDEDDFYKKGINITWSEYEEKIWCFDCEIDTVGFTGVFSGPIPIEASLILGLSWDRYNLETNEVEYFHIDKETNKMLWKTAETVFEDKL